VLLISKEECDLFKLRHVGKSADSVSNGVDVEYYRVSPELADRARSLRRGSPQFVFVGVLNYQPNSKGILSFCRTIWPHLRRAWPTAELDIVGRYPGREVCDLGQLPGVRVVGSVPDVRPYVLAADISIAPLLIARGVQNKILEALSLARPVIASPQAATGVPEIPGLFVAHTIRQWIQAVEQINGKAPTFNRWGARAREFIVENHSWSAKLQPLNHYLGLSSESEEMGAPRKLSPSRES
jgi:glycosyltransferase involved in cell wall biosynthesis